MKFFKLSLAILLFLVIGITKLNAQTVKDVDGNVYETLKIGKQTWMKENLKVAHYRNGDAIGTTQDTLSICSESTPKYQWAYGGKDNLVNTHGRLYTWYVVTDSRQVCPEGWHIPSNTEWIMLRKYLRLDTTSHKIDNEPDTALFNKLINILTKSGFSNDTGGKRGCGGLFLQSGNSWWSITESYNRSKLWDLYPVIGGLVKSYYEENNGYAVRCIKD